MEHYEQGSRHAAGGEAAEPHQEPPIQEVWAGFRQELEHPTEGPEQDLESALAWSHAVDRVFTELAGDPEFEAWVTRTTTELEQDPAFQERVARDREAFLRMVKEQSSAPEAPQH